MKVKIGGLLTITSLILCGCSKPSDGKDGRNGSSCTVTPLIGASVISCSDGTNAVVSNGVDGEHGATGPAGPQGPAGTQITIVSLCSAVTSYPLVFTEIAFCINNKLYAVYSENNGFLVETPPGNYHSNGHNSSCNFTVLPNCVINY